ncbi:MAG: transcription antitermination factor NusB [Pseudohongiellaceae bacterium]|nr:transcription antitermination factor NusB [Pseudohongiellaceae bacterium]
MPKNKEADNPKKKLSERQKARRMVLQALYQWQLASASVADIQAEFRAYYLGKIDWEYFHEVFPGIVAKVDELDEAITPLLDRQLDDLDPVELSLLRFGMYELLHRIDIPYKVVINESVELARVFGATDGHKYINGILDKAARNIRTLEIG